MKLHVVLVVALLWVTPKTASGRISEVEPPVLHIQGKPGTVYSIECSTNASDSWHCVEFVEATSADFVWHAHLPKETAGSLTFRAVPESRPGMIFVPPGTFALGDAPKADNPQAKAMSKESGNRQTRITISQGYWIATHHVTQRDFASLLFKNPSFDKNNPDHAVDRVNWFDATNYCALLTRRELEASRIPAGAAYRLPTEAQWEYATRAWATTASTLENEQSYSSVTNYAWRIIHGGKAASRAADVPDPSGLYNTRGMVSDWCLDWWAPYPGGEVTDPQGPRSGIVKIRCGGNQAAGVACCAAPGVAAKTKRLVCLPGSGGVNFSFRLVLAPTARVITPP